MTHELQKIDDECVKQKQIIKANHKLMCELIDMNENKGNVMLNILNRIYYDN